MINFYFISILLVISYHIRTNPDRTSIGNRLYGWLVNITVLLIVLDCLGRFDGYPESIYPVLNHTGNFLMFATHPILSSLWIIYVYYQINHKFEGLWKILWPIIIADLANIALVIAQQDSGWLYYIDHQNIYHRGPGFLLPAILSFVYLIWALIIIVTNRQKIEPRHFYALVLFPIPPAIGILLQFIVYGVSFMTGGVTISLLIVYLYVQAQNLNTDHLTGALSRRGLEAYLQGKIRNLPSAGTFAAIMLDIDNLKKINDTFGHDVGDKVLTEAVKLVRGSLRKQDFVARYGGDEFYIILKGVDNNKDLVTVVEKIQTSITKFNSASNKPYQIQFSMGYAVYDQNSGMGMEAFLKHIDSLMYENKRRKVPEQEI